MTFPVRRRCLGLALAVCVVSACGSTVAEQAGPVGAAGAGLYPTAPGSAQPGTGIPSSGTPGIQGTAGGAADPTSGSGTDAAAGRSAGPTTGPLAATIRPQTAQGRLPSRQKGITDTTINVGLLYSANQASQVNSLGFGTAYTQGDEKAELQALVADINSRGGLFGRKVVLHVRDVGSLTDTSGFESACVYFTQDQPVMIVFSGAAFTADFLTCLNKHDVAFSYTSNAPSGRLLDQVGLSWWPDDVRLERLVALIAHAQIDGGYFRTTAKPVIGVIHDQSADQARVTKDVLRPILAKAGYRIEDEEAVDVNSTDPSIASGVVLKMQSLHVTHVIMYTSPLTFMAAAESQQWRPAWTITSNAGPGPFLSKAAPPSQLQHAMGPGWAQRADLDSPQIKGPVSTAETRCLDIMHRAGVFVDQGLPTAVALGYCTLVFHWQAVMATVTELSSRGFRTAAERLPGYLSPTSWGNAFTGGRHDGASRYRYNAYQQSCRCFQYVSGLRDIPA